MRRFAALWSWVLALIAVVDWGISCSGATHDSPPAAVGDQIARLAIIGSGAPAGTVALFGHGFARGQLSPTESVVLQSTDGKTTLPTQFNAITSWPDGSVKVALLAVECPALADGEKFECVLAKRKSPAGAAPPLDPRQLLRNRTARLTIAPQSGSAWTVDLLEAVAGNDRWHDGPLAVSFRVEKKVPPERVGGSTSLRLVADVIVTKDGILEIDWRLANDLMMKPGGGPATYSYRVTIDGVDVYTQQQATHIQYTAWVRRAGRGSSGPMPARPVIQPDFDLLVRGGFTLPWDRSLPSAAYEGYITRTIASELPNANHPYPAWGVVRSAGAVGGRQEIGYRTYASMIWLKNGDPAAQFLAHRQLEVGMSRPQNFWDDELGTWLNPEDWPKFTSGVPWQNTSPAGTQRHEARGFPEDQRPAANDRDHVTVDHAHNADYWSVVALLSGRRMAFDGLAMNAAWQTIDHNDRHRPEYRMDWRSFTPDYKTGLAWAPRLGAPQTRGFAWGLRDVCLAAALLPDRYPRREFYNRNALAWINSYGVNLQQLAAEQGELAGYVPHTNLRTHVSGFMSSFLIYAILDAVNLGVAGQHGLPVLEYFASFRVNSFNSPDFNWRNAASGKDLFIGDGKNLFTKWSQAQARHVEANQDIDPQWSKTWPGEGDWQRNVLAGLALLRDAPLPLELRAKAADAMVLYRSERPKGRDGFPRIQPHQFFGAFENLNSLCPHGSTWRWDVPPVVRAGQRFRAVNPKPGELIGLVVTDGGLPRASRPEGDDAFVIVAQPPAKPFAISRGGAIKLAGEAPKGRVVIEVYATTYDDDNKEHRGPTVPVEIQIVDSQNN